MNDQKIEAPKDGASSGLALATGSEIPALPIMVQEIKVGQLLAVRGMNNDWVTCRVIAYTKGNSLGEKVFIEARIESFPNVEMKHDREKRTQP